MRPTHEPMQQRARGDEPSANVAAVGEFALQAGSLILSSGAAASEVAQAMLDIADAARLGDVTVDINYSALLFTHTPPGETPYLRIETIGGRVFNYGRLTASLRVVERFCGGELTLEQARAEADRVAAAAGLYPWWLARLAAGFAGASAALIFGGDWLAMLIAFAANVVIDYLFGLLVRHEWPVFFIQVIAGFVGVLSALLLHAISPGSDPSRVVIAVIIVMLAGMTTTGGVQDALTGWYMTGIGRITEAVTNTVGLIVGVRIGLILAERIGVDLAISSNVSMKALSLWVMLIAAAFVGVNFSFVAQNAAPIIPAVALLSSAAYAVDILLVRADYGAVWSAAAAAAFVAGVIAVFLAHRLRAAANAFATCAILPMVPGVLLYQGLSQSTQHLSPLVTAAGTALALAGGVAFGEYVATVVHRRLRLPEHRVYAPLFADPIAIRQRTRFQPRHER